MTNKSPATYSDEFPACSRAGLVPSYNIWFGGFFITAAQVEKALKDLEARVVEMEEAKRW